MPAHDESAEFGDGVVVVPKSCRIRGIGSTGRKCTGDHKDASLNLMPCRLNEGGAMAPRREGEAFCGHRNVFTVRLTFSNGRRSRRSDEHDRNPPSSLSFPCDASVKPLAKSKKKRERK